MITWTNIKERLPEPPEFVIVASMIKGPVIAVYNGGGFYEYLTGESLRDMQITHWSEINPPNKEKL